MTTSHQPKSTIQQDENPSPGVWTEKEVTVNTQRFRFIPRVVERKLGVAKRQTGTTVVISYQPVPQTQQDGNRCLVTPIQRAAKRPIAERCLIEPKRLRVPKKKRCLITAITTDDQDHDVTIFTYMSLNVGE
uniref:Uncharacterized protein n=1 Tax=Anopheles merus TaxID=30066 RepID=A0A182UYC4_ANOME